MPMNKDRISQLLRSALADPTCAGIRFTQAYEPFGGAGQPVTPPAGHLNARAKGRLLPVEKQQGLFSLPGGGQGVVLNSYAAQANRYEAALKRHATALGYPLVRVRDTNGVLYDATSLDWPHRNADTHWRLLHKPFEDATGDDEYNLIRLATASNATPLLLRFPNAPLYGWWHSQSGEPSKRGKAGKTPEQREQLVLIDETRKVGHVPGETTNTESARNGRVVASEILARGVTVQERLAARLDPFGAMPGGQGGPGTGFSTVGLGTIPPVPGVRDVLATSIDGFATVSFAMLRRFRFPGVVEDKARLLLTLLALVGILAADTDLHLRSGGELQMTSVEVQLLSHGRDPSPLALGPDDLPELIAETKRLGQELGWKQPVTVDADARYAELARIGAKHTAVSEEDDGGAAATDTDGE